MCFKCRAGCAVATTSRSERRAPTGAVSAARGAAPAPPPWAARPPPCWTRASAPTSEVRARGLPGSRAPARGPALLRGPWPQRARGGARPAPGVPRPPSTCGAPPAGAGSSGAHGDRRGQLSPCAAGAARPRSGEAALRPGARGRGVLWEARRHGCGRQVRAAGWGTRPCFLGSARLGVCSGPGPETPRSPLSSELFLNLPQREPRGYPSFMKTSRGIPGL